MQWFPIARCSAGRGLSKSGERRPQPALRLKLVGLLSERFS